MSQYEFSQSDSTTIRKLSVVMKRVGILWIVLGVISFLDNLATTYAFGSDIALSIGALVFVAMTVGFGVLLLRPVDNLHNVAETEGKDISEMMTAVDELAGGFKIVNIIFVVGMTIYVLATILTS